MEFIKKYSVLLLKLALVVSLFLLLTHNAQFKPDLLLQFFSHPYILISVISIFFLMIALGSWRWHILNSAQGANLDFFSTFISTYIGAGYSNILPGTVGGDFIRWFYLLKKIPDKKSSVLFSVLFDRILGLIGVCIAVAVIFIISKHSQSPDPKLYYPFLLFTLLCIAMLGGFFTLITFSGKINLDQFFLQRFPQNKWAKRASNFFEALRLYEISTYSIIKCLFLSVTIQITMGLGIMMIADVMGFTGITLSDYIIAASLTQIVNLIPATPGGVGIGEMAFANILFLLNPGIHGAHATIYFAYRLISMLTYLPGVILFIPRVLAMRLNRAAA